MRVTRLFFCVVVIGLLGVPVLAEPTDDAVKWKSLEQSGCTLKYQDGDEGLAKQLLPEIVKRVERVAADKAPSQIDLVNAKRKELLAAVADEYGMERPSKEMGKVLDACLKALLPLQEAVRKCRVFELTRGDADESGEQESTFLAYDPVSGAFGWLLRTAADGERKFEFDTKCIPITVGSGEGSDLEKAMESFDDLRDMQAAGLVCHELAEITLMLYLNLSGAYVRWFGDGMGTYVGAKVAEKLFGKGPADALRRAHDAREYADMVDKIDLLAWRGSVWETDMPFVQPRATSACYAFSCKEMKELVERHGNVTVKWICNAVISSKDKVRNEKTLISAIKSVTGEDMRKVLGKYGSKCEDKFRGIAVKDFACYSYSAKNGNAQLGERSTVIELVDRGGQGLIVGFNIDLLDKPAFFQASLREQPQVRRVLSATTFPAGADSEPVVLPIECSSVYSLQPGEYPLEITVNGQLLKEIKLKLVKPGSTSSPTE